MADREREGYVLSPDASRVDVDTVHRWLSLDAYWALGRPREVVEKTIESSWVWSVFAPEGEQVAFLRAVTNGLPFAWVCDGYFHPAHRGHGIATWVSAEAVGDVTAVGVDR